MMREATAQCLLRSMVVGHAKNAVMNINYGHVTWSFSTVKLSAISGACMI